MTALATANATTQAKTWAHRTCAPETSFARMRSAFETVGITRIADLTDLDVLGIPVFQAVRPLGRSLSVSQGKGMSASAARVSAVMESIEIWHAEMTELPRLNATRHRLAGRSVISPDQISYPNASAVPGDLKLDWTPAWDLIEKDTIFVPADCANMDFTRDASPPQLARCTTGLAGGNTMAEAQASALSEVIERSCEADFMQGDARAKSARRLDLKPLAEHCAPVAHLLEKITSAGLFVDLYDITNRFRLPTIRAEIYGCKGPTAGHHAAMGHGAHLDPVAALTRAITEAAQARLAYISGNRDDLDARYFCGGEAMNLMRLVSMGMDGFQTRRSFSLVDQSTSTPQGDVDVMLARIEREGAGPVAMLDLTKPELGIPVTKIVAPNICYLARR